MLTLISLQFLCVVGVL